MKNKKALLIKFIFMGVVILIVASLMIYTAHEIQRKKLENVKYFSPKAMLKYYITKCIENTGSYALLKLGMQGGYIYLPNSYLDDSNLNVDYVQYYNNYSLASLDQMTKELNRFMDNNLKHCAYKYTQNIEMDFELEFGNVTTNTVIAAKDVSFYVNFPIKIVEENSKTKLKSFKAELPVRLYAVHKLIDNLLEKKTENKFDVYHDCFYDPKMNLTVVDYGDSTLFVLEDEGSRYKNIESKAGPYRFLFAVKN